MKRLFWLGLGVATGVMVTRKAADAVQRLTPTGVGEQIGDGLRALALAIGEFGAEVRAGMAEREHELTELVEYRTGQALPRAAAAPQVPAPRARRAGGRG
ncbi:MAG: hypothetical protein ACR2G2_07815 [Pseudonocardia sp.]